MKTGLAGSFRLVNTGGMIPHVSDILTDSHRVGESLMAVRLVIQPDQDALVAVILQFSCQGIYIFFVLFRHSIAPLQTMGGFYVIYKSRPIVNCSV